MTVPLTAAISLLALGTMNQEPSPFVETIPKSVVKIEMLPIPGGTVKIGERDVAVKPFHMAKTETVWEAYDAFLLSGEPSPPYDETEFAADAIARPSKTYILADLNWGHQGYPAINISDLSATMFCRWLASVTGKKYRLPTEAEWELACRGGVPGEWTVDPTTLEETSWNLGNSKRTTHPVATKKPNAFGLHDMLGNVGEWATDLDGKSVLCGGTFQDEPSAISPTTRKRWTPKWQERDPQIPQSRWWLSNGPFAGFRVVCEGA